MKFLYLMIASLIFFPTQEYSAHPADYGLISENVSLKTEDGVKLAGWYLKAPESEKTIYFLHGNAGNMADRLFKAAEWVKRGYSVFLLDYRGYGASEGKIRNENDLYADARAGLIWLRAHMKLSNSEIVLYGESIGTTAVVDLASKECFFALILESPFTSFKEVTKVHYPFFPGFLLSPFQFDNKSKIQSVDTPVFIIHGKEDEICPWIMGEALYERIKAPKQMFSVPRGHHNDLSDIAGAEFYEKPIQFLNQIKGSA